MEKGKDATLHLSVVPRLQDVVSAGPAAEEFKRIVALYRDCAEINRGLQN